MSNLLSANFSRLRKNKLFWIALALMAVLSAFAMYMNVLDARQWKELYNQTVYFDSVYFVLAPFIGLPITVITVFYLGTDYSDGTIRNKITAGHTRTEIYSANLLTCVLVSALFSAVWLLCGLIGLPFMECVTGAGEMLLYAAVSLLFGVSAGAIAALVGMLISNKAGSAAVSILLYFAMEIATSAVILRLDEPEMYSYAELTEEGMQMVGPVANPRYIGGALRVILECIANALPSGQAIMLSNMELDHPVFDMVVSAFLTVFVSAVGLMIFNKKDIR